MARVRPLSRDRGRPADDGRLADGFGAKRVFLAGLAIVLAAAALAPWAPSLGWLVAARVMLGIGTSAAYPAGIAMIRAWSQRHARGETPTSSLGAISIAAQVAVAFGRRSAACSFSTPAGAACSGSTCRSSSSRSCSARRGCRPTPARAPRRPSLREQDWLGAALFVATLASLLSFLQTAFEAPDWPLLGACAAFGALLVGHERRVGEPLVDVRMLAGNRPLVATYLRCIGTYMVFYAIFYALPMWLQDVKGLAARDAGLVMLPISAFGTVTTLVATRLTHRRGSRPVLVFGSAMLCVGCGVMALMSADMPVWAIVPLSIVFGIPNGFNNLGNQATLYRSAPGERIGAAAGLYRTAQYVGGGLSFALVGIAFGHAASDRGLHALALSLLAVSALLLFNAASSRHIDAAGASPVPQQK
ncbi:MFS transporter [Burkholderia pseudomallei]|nr:MFS transporter [Burkholderia pseudomallei]